MREEIEQTFKDKLLALDPNDPTFEARKYSINIERAENLNELESMNEYKKRIIRNVNFLTLTKDPEQYKI